jgi:hypothetical protein
MAIKDRAEHLAITLPLTLAHMEADDELNIIDYGSGNRNELKAVLTEWPDSRINASRYETIYWRVAHAKNLAHMMATHRILCNLDADNWVRPGFSLMLSNLVDGDRMARPVQRTDRRAGGDGRIAMTREAFTILGGYDERMERWGYDASDIKARAEAAGMTLMDITVDEFMDHDDNLRDSRGLSTYNARFLKNNLATGLVNPNAGRYGQGNLVPIL